MMRYLSLLVLAGLLSACAQSPKQEAAMLPDLDAYHWQLQDAHDAQGKRVEDLFVLGGKPVMLDFKGNRLTVSNTCNIHMGSLKTTNDHKVVVAGPLASTMRACLDPKIAKRDDRFFSLFRENARIERVAGDPPKLMVISPTGGEAYQLTFTGIPTAETRYQSEGEIHFLEIAAKKESCNHPSIPNQHSCLQVREIRYDTNGIRMGKPGAWQNFYSGIEGYVHQDGVRNVLRVKRFKLAQPAADGSGFAYVLDLIVESELVKR